MNPRTLVIAFACAATAMAGTSAYARAPRPPRHRPVVHPRPSVALGAHESEYRIRTTRSSLPAGRVVVEVRNLGQDPHDLQIAGGNGPRFGFGVARPGTRRTQTVQLTRGTWHLFCSVPGHEARGMSATIQVN